MGSFFVHVGRLVVTFLACVLVLLWLHVLLSYYQRTKDRWFWWAAAVSLLGWTYLAEATLSR